MKYKPTNDELAQLYYNASGAKTFYKGTSFRCNVWENNTHYFHNEQYIDFVIYERNLLMCLRDHLSSKDNAPEKKLVGDQYQVLNSPLWEVVIAQLDQVQTLPAGGSVGQILIKQSNEDYDIVWSDAPETGAADITAVANAINSEQTSVSVDVNKDGSTYKLSFDFELQKGLNGAPGKDGHTPIIGVAKDTDGFYYWTIDEEWLLDAEHNKIKATGIDGKDGSDQQTIYTITVDPEIDASLDPSKLDSQQEDSFIPNGWFDVPQQVTIQQPYQLQSTRYKRNGAWSKYSDPIIYNQYWQDGNFFEVSFTRFVFCKTSKTWIDTDIKPSGGSYENPFPVNSGTISGEAVEWVDSIPVGIGQVWMSSATFTNNSEEVTWSTPVPMSDTNDFKVEYSSAEYPVNPESLQSYYDSDLTNYETSWRQNNPDWTDKGENAIWMATCKMHNGEWGEWSINKTKGEDGTSVAIKEGNYTSESDLPENANIGDCYLIDGNLWAWDGDSWVNAGNIKGDPGTNGKDGVDGKDGINGTDGKDGAPGADGKDGNDGLSAWVHVKYATVEPANDYVFDENNIWSGFTESNGKTPGPYIGIYADHNEDDSLDPTKYKWTKWQGEDGWGYEYIYQRTSKYEAPELPISENNDNYIPDNWSDDPMDVSEDYPYGWMCYRIKQNGTWSEFKGSKENPGYASLWAKYGEKGDAGVSIVSVTEYYLLSEKTTDVTTESEGWSTEISSPTDGKHLWNYETINYSDNTQSSTTPVIIAYYTKDGVSITNIKEEYALSTSNTEVTGDWNETIPTMNPINCYLWNRETIVYSDSTETVLDPVIIGVHGQDGTSFTIAGQYETVEGLREAYDIEFGSGKTWKESTAWIIGNRYYYIFRGEWIDFDNAFYTIDGKGEKGDPGVGIDSITPGKDGSIDITTTDGNKESIAIPTLNSLTMYKRSSDIDGELKPIISGLKWSGVKWTWTHIEQEWSLTIPDKNLEGDPCYSITHTWTGVATTPKDVSENDWSNPQLVPEGSPMIYPAGEWSSEKEYIVTGSTAPYVKYEGVFYVATKTPDDTLTPDKSNCWITLDKFDAIYTDIIFAGKGQVGSVLFNGDWMYSQQGINVEDFHGGYTSISDIIGGKSQPNFAINCLTGQGYFSQGAFRWDSAGNIMTSGTMKALGDVLYSYKSNDGGLVTTIDVYDLTKTTIFNKLITGNYHAIAFIPAALNSLFEIDKKYSCTAILDSGVEILPTPKTTTMNGIALHEIVFTRAEGTSTVTIGNRTFEYLNGKIEIY